MKWIYSIEMFKNGQWITEKRIYYVEKKLSDFDLHDIPFKRKNAKLIATQTKF